MRNRLLLLLALLWFVPSVFAEDPDSFKRGLRSYVMRDYEGATAHWLETLSLYPGHKKTHLYLEKAYEKSKEIKDQYFSGVNFLSQNDCDNAIQSFSAVVLLNPNYRDVIPLLKKSYELCGLKVVVRTSSNGGGVPFTNRTVTIDDSYTLFAAVYKQEKYLGDMPFSWNVFGQRNSELTPNLNLAFLRLGSLGKITLAQDATDQKDVWISQEIECLPGKAALFQVLNAKTGNVPKELVVRADESLTFITKSFDVAGNELKPIPVVWTVFSNPNPHASMVMSKGISPWYEMQLPSSSRKYSVMAERVGLPPVIISNITVLPGKPAYVIVEDREADGSEVYNRQLLQNEKLELFAIAYDKFNNRIGPWKVRWVGDEGWAGTFPVDLSSKLTIKGISGKNGLVKAVPETGISEDETGIIAVLQQEFGRLEILDLHRVILSNLEIVSGEEVHLAAGIFDKSGAFIKESRPQWKVFSSTGKVIRSFEGDLFGFKAEGKDSPLRVEAELELDGKWQKDSLKISVSHPPLRSIELRKLSDNTSLEMVRIGMDETLDFYVEGYDAKGNPVPMVNEPVFAKSDRFKMTRLDRGYRLVPVIIGSDQLMVSLPTREKEKVSDSVFVEILTGKPVIGKIVFQGKTNTEFFVTNNTSLAGLKLAGFDRSGYFAGWLEPRWYFDRQMKDVESVSVSNRDLLVDAEMENVKAQAVFRTAVESEISFVADNEMIRYEVRTNDILYGLVMKTLGFSAAYPQIRRELESIGKINNVRNINLIYPKKFILFPYVRLKKSVTYSQLKEYLLRHYQVNRVIIHDRVLKDHEMVRPEDKIIIFHPAFLEKGYGFFND